MLAYDCLVAAVLLTAAPDVPAAPEALAWAEACRAPLLALALDAQLLDAREEMNHFTRAQDAASDLKALQSRFRDFAFAPLLEESRRFPDRQTVNGFLAFNRAYRLDLLTRLEVDPVHAGHLRDALQETDELHHVWNVLREAQSDYYVTARRQTLLMLRDLLGYEAFYAGRLPPYVPVWRLPVAR
jgi:hypothetical protein